MEREPYIQSNAVSFIQVMRKKANRIIIKKKLILNGRELYGDGGGASQTSPTN